MFGTNPRKRLRARKRVRTTFRVRDALTRNSHEVWVAGHSITYATSLTSLEDPRSTVTF
jgi:hypothetical protein